MNTMIKLFLMEIVVIVAAIGLGIQHVMALGDCYDCNFTFGGEHHDHSDCDDGTDCGDNNGG
jgi:hypothetical protein